MVRMLCLAFAVTAISAVPSLAQRVSSAEIVERGVIEPRTKAKIQKNDDISTGNFTSYDKLEVSEETSTITMKDGRVFGAYVRLSGSPNNEVASIKVVWIYPEPGLKNPKTGEIKMRDEFPGGHRLGTSQYYYWTLGDAWTQVPGPWTFQLWQGDRRLVQQVFQLK